MEETIVTPDTQTSPEYDHLVTAHRAGGDSKMNQGFVRILLGLSLLVLSALFMDAGSKTTSHYEQHEQHQLCSQEYAGSTFVMHCEIQPGYLNYVADEPSPTIWFERVLSLGLFLGSLGFLVSGADHYADGGDDFDSAEADADRELFDRTDTAD